MRGIIATLIAASCYTETTAWGYGRIAWNGRHLIVPDNQNVRTYTPWLKQAKQVRMRIRNPWNACWLGAGIFTTNSYVFFNEFCGNNGWFTRCNLRGGFRNHCYRYYRKGGYGGFGMASYGGNMYRMVWAARHPYGWPSNNYQQRNMRWMVFGDQNMNSYSWWCWSPYGEGIADITQLDRWNYGGQMGVLRNIPGNHGAHWMELTLWGNRRSCWHRRNFHMWNVCPTRRRYSQAWGMTYVTGRRRMGWMFFTCKHEMYHIKRRNMYWAHHYRGQILGDTEVRKPTTTTTTTTTIVPITMRTWSFPETLSWKIRRTDSRKTECQGGKYADWYVAIKYKKCKLKTGWHKIYCSDKFKEGFHGGFVQVKNYKLCKKNFEWAAGKHKVEKFYVRA